MIFCLVHAKDIVSKILIGGAVKPCSTPSPSLYTKWLCADFIVNVALSLLLYLNSFVQIVLSKLQGISKVF